MGGTYHRRILKEGNGREMEKGTIDKREKRGNEEYGEQLRRE